MRRAWISSGGSFGITSYPPYQLPVHTGRRGCWEVTRQEVGLPELTSLESRLLLCSSRFRHCSVEHGVASSPALPRGHTLFLAKPSCHLPSCRRCATGLHSMPTLCRVILLFVYV